MSVRYYRCQQTCCALACGHYLHWPDAIGSGPDPAPMPECPCCRSLFERARKMMERYQETRGIKKSKGGGEAVASTQLLEELRSIRLDNGLPLRCE